MCRRTVLICAVALLNGCSWVGGSRPDPTLATLPQAPVVVPPSRPQKADLADAMQRYQALLELKPERRLGTEATRRLADLELERSERRMATGGERTTPKTLYANAIQRYEMLLRTYPRYKATDEVLYQLARAYDSAGRPDRSTAMLERLVRTYPESPYVTEAWFRLGEYRFARRDYAGARRAYRRVLGSGSETVFHDRARYKLGWALFKAHRTKASLDAFMALLDRRLPKGGEPDAASLSKSDRVLVNDTLRAVSLDFAAQGGASAVRHYFAAAPRDYEYRIYRHLGDLYLKQDRIQDAADTFLAFVEHNPAHPRAPDLQVRVVEAWAKGGFANKARAARAAFVERYRIGGPIWQRQDERSRARLRPHLLRYLHHLSHYHHALAQAALKRHMPDPQAMEKAVGFYRQIVQGFPKDAKTPASHFLMAELLFDYRRFPEAAAAYEQVAYEYGDRRRAAEAGYAALLAYAAMEKEAKGQGKIEWQRREVESALRFADHFPSDRRWAQVLTRAADRLFAAGDAPRAIDAAERVVARRPRVDRGLARTAWTVIAHARFGQKQYARAEAAYVEALKRTPAHAKQRHALMERLAAAVYEQGETLRKKGRHAEAAKAFLRVARVAPGASICAKADFDAATAHMAAKQWTQAARVLERFRKQYPNDSLRPEAERNLAVTYLRAGKETRAADVLVAVAAGAGDAAMRREAGWQAAALYEKADRVDAAARAWEQYIEHFPKPLEPAVEARWHLAGLAAKKGRVADRVRWLREIVAADGRAGKAATARTRFLAATSALALAERKERAFDSIRLVHPLRVNLKRKKAHMQAAIDAYAAAAGYAVAEVATAASYRIAHLYQRFGEALMKSERPKGLSKAERAQYDVLLEEQAYPFEEKAIELHRANTRRTTQGIYDAWVKKSFAALARLQPGRYARQERVVEVIDALD